MINSKKLLLSGFSRNHKRSDSAWEHWKELLKMNRLLKNKVKFVLDGSGFISFVVTKPNFLFSCSYRVSPTEPRKLSSIDRINLGL